MLKPVTNAVGIPRTLSVERRCLQAASKVYQLAVDRLSKAPNTILFLSSNAWDAYAASAFGLRVAWCNRCAQPRERLPGVPDREIRTLAELPSLLDL
jgi:2-haloacid dehalogenase